MKNWFSNLLGDTNTQGRNIFVIALMTFGVSLLATPLYVYLAVQDGSWQIYVMLGMAAAYMLASLQSAGLARQNRTDPALAWILGGFYFIVPLLTAVTSGMGLILAVTEVLGVLLIISQTLSGPRATRAFMGGVAAAIVTVLIDQLAPWERASFPLLSKSIPYIAGIALLALTIYVFRGYRQYSLRAKLFSAVGFYMFMILVQGVAGYYYTRDLTSRFNDLTENNLQAAVQLADAQNALWQLRYGFPQFLVLEDDPAAREQIVADEAKWYAEINTNMEAYAAGSRSLEEQEALQTWNDVFVEYTGARPRWFELVTTGKLVEAAEWRAQTTTPFGREAVATLNTLIELQRQVAAQKESELAAETRSAVIVLASAVVLALVVGLIISSLVFQGLYGPINRLTQVSRQIAEGDFEAQAVVESQDELGALATSFNFMTGKIRNTLVTVQQRSQEIALASEVGRSVSQVRALDIMLKDAVETVRSRFDLYYAQVYLTDSSQTNLVLLAGSGKVGEQLVRRGHRLPLNTSSINGRAATEKKSVVIADTSASASFRPNPLLPDARSEMAVPLIVGERVVGVLDLQSEKASALNQELLPAFEALAGQLAIAIQNANLLAETEQARAEVEAQARRLVRSNWAEYLDAIHQPEETGFVFEQNKVMPLLQTEETQNIDKGNLLAAPIEVTGEAVGSLVVEMDRESSIARTDELVNTVARQVAQHIEALRLLETAERYRAEAEQASRRLTREGWKTYVEHAEGSLGYFYDLKEVKAHTKNGDDQPAVTLPLKVRDEVLGKLAIQGLDANDSQALEFVETVAEYLSAHIESLRQFEETKRGQVELDRRAQQLAAVAEISTASSKELDIQKMLESVVHLTQRKFDLYHAHVFTYNEHTDELQIMACGWDEGNENEGAHESNVIPMSSEQSLVALAARTRQAVIVNDVRNEPDWLPNPLLPNTISELAVPLVIGDQVLGVLDVQSDRINAFGEEDANIQSTLASQVATALQNARSFARAQQQATRESTLNVISQKIQSATSVEAVLQIAARELGYALGAPMTVAQLSMKDKA